MALIALVGLPITGSAETAKQTGPAPTSSAAAFQASVDKQRASLELQRASLAKQSEGKLEELSFDPAFFKPLPPDPPLDCAPLSKDDVDSLISAAAKKQSLQPELLRAVMRQESAFKPCAVSAKGAQGLMQLMPATSQQLHVADPFDPAENVSAGAAYLKQLLQHYGGDLRLALVAYNAGTARADQPDPNQYPGETQGYLANIFAELSAEQVETATAAPSAEPAAETPPDAESDLGATTEPSAPVSPTEQSGKQPPNRP